MVSLQSNDQKLFSSLCFSDNIGDSRFMSCYISLISISPILIESRSYSVILEFKYSTVEFFRNLENAWRYPQSWKVMEKSVNFNVSGFRIWEDTEMHKTAVTWTSDRLNWFVNCTFLSVNAAWHCSSACNDGVPAVLLCVKLHARFC